MKEKAKIKKTKLLLWKFCAGSLLSSVEVFTTES